MGKYNYADTEAPVFGKEDFEDNLRMVTELAILRNDNRRIEVRLLCKRHPGKGLDVIYEDGMIVVACVVCTRMVGQIEVAEFGRDWGEAILVN